MTNSVDLMLFSFVVAAATIASTNRTGLSQTPPATVPVPEPRDLSIVSYSGYRLLNAKVSGNGSRVVLNLDHPSSGRSVVRVHDTATGQKQFEREAAAPQVTLVTAYAISQDGSRIVVCDALPRSPYPLKVIDLAAGETVWEGSMGAGDATFLDPAGDLLLVSHLTPALPRGTRELFSVSLRNKQEMWRSPVNAAPGKLTVSPDAMLLLAAVDAPGPDAQAIVDISSRRILATLERSAESRISDGIAFLKGRGEVVGTIGHVLTRWDASSGKIVESKATIGQLGNESRIVFSPDGRRFYVRDGFRFSAHDSLSGAVTSNLSVPPRATLHSVSNNGVAVLQMTPVASLRIIAMAASNDQ